MSSKLQLYNIKIFFSKQNTSYSFPRTTHNRFFFEKTTRDGVRNRLTQREKQALYSQHFTFRSFIITAGREPIFSERFERKKRVLETRLHSYGGVRINRSEVSLSQAVRKNLIFIRYGVDRSFPRFKMKILYKSLPCVSVGNRVWIWRGDENARW